MEDVLERSRPVDSAHANSERQESVEGTSVGFNKVTLHYLQLHLRPLDLSKWIRRCFRYAAKQFTA